MVPWSMCSVLWATLRRVACVSQVTSCTLNILAQDWLVSRFIVLTCKEGGHLLRGARCARAGSGHSGTMSVMHPRSFNSANGHPAEPQVLYWAVGKDCCGRSRLHTCIPGPLKYCVLRSSRRSNFSCGQYLQGVMVEQDRRLAKLGSSWILTLTVSFPTLNKRSGQFKANSSRCIYKHQNSSSPREIIRQATTRDFGCLGCSSA